MIFFTSSFICVSGKIKNGLFVCFLPSQVSCGIFVLWPGIKPMTLAVKAKNSKNWTAREFMQICFKQLPTSHGFGFLVGTKEVMCRITETFHSLLILLLHAFLSRIIYTFFATCT